MYTYMTEPNTVPPRLPDTNRGRLSSLTGVTLSACNMYTHDTLAIYSSVQLSQLINSWLCSIHTLFSIMFIYL